MSVLVSGGAGYIGSHVVRLLRERGDDVVVVDDLITGVRERIAGVPFEQADLADPRSVEPLARLMELHAVDAVIHFAARKRVDESVSRPAWYYQQNIGSTATVLLAAELAGVDRVVFSSSAAVYGASDDAQTYESAVLAPGNAYGQTKLAGEWMLDAATHAADFRSASLRYFNVAGAGWPDLADTAVLNLVPMVFERILGGQRPLIFGDDYATEDGTCIRDYVHVRDLADAHLATLDFLASGPVRHEIFNVGTGTGSSVLQMVDEILSVSGSDLRPEFRDRRPGDPASVVANVDHISTTLGWTASHTLHDIVTSAWAGFLAAHPGGLQSAMTSGKEH